MSFPAALNQGSAEEMKWFYPDPGFYDPPPIDKVSDLALTAGTYWQAPVSNLHAPAYVATVTGTVLGESRAWYDYPVIQPEGSGMENYTSLAQGASEVSDSGGCGEPPVTSDASSSWGWGLPATSELPDSRGYQGPPLTYDASSSWGWSLPATVEAPSSEAYWDLPATPEAPPSRGYSGLSATPEAPPSGVRFSQGRRRKERASAGAWRSNLSDYVTSARTPKASPKRSAAAQPRWTSKPTKMRKFQDFPSEIRDNIYECIVVAEGPIRPHLCSSDPQSRPRFHDESRDYNGVHRSLAISYTSKQVRREVLKVFYARNTFAWSHDLATYLEYMRYIGRIHYIQQVKFSVDFLKEAPVSTTVKQLTKVCQQQEDWSKAFLQKAAEPDHQQKLKKYRKTMWETFSGSFMQPEGSKAHTPENEEEEAIAKEKVVLFKTLMTSDLQSMPLHKAGGLEPFSTMLILRNLSFKREGHANPGDEDLDREITMRVPAAAIFDQYYSLMWFPKMVASMGIKLKMLDGGGFGLMDGSVEIGWVRKYQRKGVEMEKEKLGPLERNKVMERAERMFAGLKHLGNTRPSAYYRRLCSEGIEWFKVE
ncbi:hypothetical protein P154DRAFT_124630 [Amniculicola lignicola CBS 123094]|uniref:Uncharacterized protein n=1 Tax=Amniculicola lignicola CBS 123094 TaxID=1392246 RepID=A0A6A5WZA1_9PLEO|nr:hypothetical protein P154DRAFT_124630 [Amniculicola lignicola CBS 123094]